MRTTYCALELGRTPSDLELLELGTLLDFTADQASWRVVQVTGSFRLGRELASISLIKELFKSLEASV